MPKKNKKSEVDFWSGCYIDINKLPIEDLFVIIDLLNTKENYTFIPKLNKVKHIKDANYIFIGQVMQREVSYFIEKIDTSIFKEIALIDKEFKYV